MASSEERVGRRRFSSSLPLGPSYGDEYTSLRAQSDEPLEDEMMSWLAGLVGMKTLAPGDASLLPDIPAMSLEAWHWGMVVWFSDEDHIFRRLVRHAVALILQLLTQKRGVSSSSS
eukprot:TRINITY_DN27678_c0_g1_i1.p1 TRINITY_DN27678_c0_g1~~TRINITY_DN27678_c0_g1_i1.p1  ORF type:complete len:116 (-),score=14.04 TRINITY_DN27678_c0_g1_i1:658-1005(-)